MTILVNGYGNNFPSHRTCVENSLTRKSYVVFLRKLIINRAGVNDQQLVKATVSSREVSELTFLLYILSLNTFFNQSLLDEYDVFTKHCMT